MPRPVRRFHPLLFVSACAVVLAACASERTLTPEQYEQRLPALEARAEANPSNAAALRDLGEAYAQTGAYRQAENVLQRAEAAAPDDPKTLYYLGVSKEGLEQPDAALTVFARYRDLPPRSRFQQLMAGRHGWLLRALLRDELAALVAAEDSLTAEGVTEAIAVFPLTYQGQDSLYRPLGRGLSEMLTVDLASVEGLRVVERLRLQTLLDELALTQNAAFDAETVPRLGRLLRSGRVVGGVLDVQNEQLRTDVALWDWPSEPLPGLSSRQAGLAELFALEKEIVFDLLVQLGIELAPAEREALARVPTRDLQAFLAYSRGLLEEDAGRFVEAAAFYSQAVRLDPGFAEAAQKNQEAQAMAEVAGGVDMALAAPRRSARPPGGTSLVHNRLTLLNQNLGAHVVPGDEAREPTADVPLDPLGAEPIPDPPPPPAGGN
ncbi:MAG: tetratricopeptide repeat protein [Rhodothermaceae bacterium]|nr:tetratricopeptide repeat protein [Rhodothermaceae bacterium]